MNRNFLYLTLAVLIAWAVAANAIPQDTPAPNKSDIRKLSRSVWAQQLDRPDLAGLGCIKMVRACCEDPTQTGAPTEGCDYTMELLDWPLLDYLSTDACGECLDTGEGNRQYLPFYIPGVEHPIYARPARDSNGKLIYTPCGDGIELELPHVDDLIEMDCITAQPVADPDFICNPPCVACEAETNPIGPWDCGGTLQN